MTFKEILELIYTIDKSQISFMELNYENVYLKLDKSLSRGDVISNNNVSNDCVKSFEDFSEFKSGDLNSEKESNNVSMQQESVHDDEEEFQYIIAPVVGTVYLSSSPGKPPYVDKEQYIKSGDVVCIIEAMKLMNEIESEYSGKIVEVLVENAQMVEYGQKLFKIKKY